jgi:hypothetical protein
MVDDSIFDRLSAYVPLTNLIGENIFAVNVPEDRGPGENDNWTGVVFMRISDSPDQDLDGSVSINRARPVFLSRF